MTKQTFDIALSNPEWKSTEQSSKDFTPLHISPACEQENNTDRTQAMKSTIADTSQDLQDKDQEAIREDLYTFREQLDKLINVLQNISTTLVTISEHKISNKQQQNTYPRKVIDMCKCFHYKIRGHIACDCRKISAHLSQTKNQSSKPFYHPNWNNFQTNPRLRKKDLK